MEVDTSQLEEQLHCGEAGTAHASELHSPVVVEPTPTVGMVFSSEDGLQAYYQRYAYQEGFGIRRVSTKSDKGRVKYFSLGCSRGGKFVSAARNSFNIRPSIKTDCRAKINVVVEGSGGCTISGVYLEHNHTLSPRKARYQRSHKRIDANSKRRLELNDKAGISLSKNYQSLVVEGGGYENLSFEERECRNYIAKVRQLRLGAGDAEALRSYFARMHKRNPNFYYVIDIGDDARLRNVFWADARSRAAYESFGDVVSFDSTYLTNKYNMPFGAFVGVNHHGQSMLFGCGLLSHEDIETYTWLFTSWLECMNGTHPKAIITDQCYAIQAAVTKVFPHSHYRLCLWHIMKKIPEKLGRLTEYKSIKRKLKSAVYESIGPNEFDENWLQMIQDYNLEGNDWLNSLFKDRNRWIPAYLKKYFWAGMSTTQRSESMNAFFDDYVNSKTSLKQFVEQYDNALKSKMEKENKADFESLNQSYTLITEYNFERQFRDAYTNNVFKLFQDELRGLLYCNSMLHNKDGEVFIFNVSDVWRGKEGNYKKRVSYTVTFNEAECDIQCSCHLFEFKGILCRHIVKILIEKDVNEVPSRYIMTRWRKDLKHHHYYVKNCYGDWGTSERDKRFDKLCAKFSKLADIAADSPETYDALMRSLDEEMGKLEISGQRKNHSGEKESTHFSHHETNSSQILLSPEQVRSKGRPPFKRKESTLERAIRKRKTQLSGGTQGVKNRKFSGSTSKRTRNKKIDASSCVESEAYLVNEDVMDKLSHIQEMENQQPSANE